MTQEFVDLEARKRNLEAQETVLLNLMDDATTTVGATIKVQRELSPSNSRSSASRAASTTSSDQTSMSTITVSFGPAGAVPPQPANAFEKAWENANDTFVAVATALVVGAGFRSSRSLSCSLWWPSPSAGSALGSPPEATSRRRGLPQWRTLMGGSYTSLKGEAPHAADDQSHAWWSRSIVFPAHGVGT